MPILSNKTQSTTRYAGSNNGAYKKNSNIKVQGGKAITAARKNDDRTVHFSERPMNNNNRENIFIEGFANNRLSFHSILNFDYLGYESSQIGLDYGLTPYFMSPDALEVQ